MTEYFALKFALVMIMATAVVAVAINAHNTIPHYWNEKPCELITNWKNAICIDLGYHNGSKVIGYLQEGNETR